MTNEKKLVTFDNIQQYHNQLSYIIDNKQDILISGSNIKTIDGYSILGDGNIVLPQIVYIPNKVLMPDHPTEGVFYMIGEEYPHQFYCTFEALENETTVTFSKNSVQFSIDGCQTWNELPANTATPVINAGDMISFKATGLVPDSSDGIGTFTVNKNFNLKGNVMAMLFGDDGYNNYDLTGYDFAFYNLFNNCFTLQSVSKDFLPATTLADGCYRGMFNGCSSLVNAPELPATTLADGCYQNMFSICTSLVNAPELPSTTLSYICYWGMFNGCSSLVTAPALPSTTLADGCYRGMFNGCSSLVNAPELPATTLNRYCYNGMFQYCSSLVNAPELPATTLASDCYSYMFDGCTTLNYIKALFTTEPSSTYTSNWVDGVSSTGIFVKNADATWDVTGVNGIPEGWTVETETLCLTIESLEDGLTAQLSTNACQYSTDRVTWIDLDVGTPTPAINTGEKLYFKATGLTPTSSAGIGTFTISKKFNLLGNCMSMLFGDNAQDKTDLTGYDYAFYKLFNNCSTLQSVSKNFLPATTLARHCYRDMFKACTGLTTLPANLLPSTTLSESCYSGMFNACGNLINMPNMPATTLSEYCYSSMFKNCTSLSIPSVLPATQLAPACYVEMFRNCISLEYFTDLKATVMENDCYSGMFRECTGLLRTPNIMAEELDDYCFNVMFYGCTSLTDACDLLSLEMKPSCYNAMFVLCTNLVNAPNIYAERFAEYCFNAMFYKCSKLSNIRLDHKPDDATCTLNWVNGVSSTGTFTTSILNSWTEGVNGIPSGWNIVYSDNHLSNYLIIEALEDDLTVSFFNTTADDNDTIQYSTDGQVWKNLSIIYNPESIAETPSIRKGDKLLFKTTGLTPTSTHGIGRFIVRKPFNLSGNCMSMLFGDNAQNKTDLTGYNYAFSGLFSDCTTLQSVSENFLPATTLAIQCYARMFSGCTGLTTAPKLPATTLSGGCYFDMFYGTNVLPDCENIDFSSSTVIQSGGLQGLFAGTKVTDSDLKNILPINSNTGNYWLPATTLANACYHSMFLGCSNLTTAPELPATTLSGGCYNSMFYGCTSLTTAPELPATTLVIECYNEMFDYCSKLNYIKAMFTTTPSSTYTENWVHGVASSGTFVKNAAATWNVTGVDGIPEGWTVQLQ